MISFYVILFCNTNWCILFLCNLLCLSWLFCSQLLKNCMVFFLLFNWFWSYLVHNLLFYVNYMNHESFSTFSYSYLCPRKLSWGEGWTLSSCLLSWSSVSMSCDLMYRLGSSSDITVFQVSLVFENLLEMLWLLWLSTILYDMKIFSIRSISVACIRTYGRCSCLLFCRCS